MAGVGFCEAAPLFNLGGVTYAIEIWSSLVDELDLLTSQRLLNLARGSHMRQASPSA